MKEQEISKLRTSCSFDITGICSYSVKNYFQGNLSGEKLNESHFTSLTGVSYNPLYKILLPNVREYLIIKIYPIGYKRERIC